MKIEEVMNQIPQQFNTRNTEGIAGIVQFHFTGSKGSNWVIKMDENSCTVAEGKTKTPDLVIKTSAENGVKLLTGKLDVMRAYMFGKIKVSGDLGLAMKLVSLFG